MPMTNLNASLKLLFDAIRFDFLLSFICILCVCLYCARVLCPCVLASFSGNGFSSISNDFDFGIIAEQFDCKVGR